MSRTTEISPDKIMSLTDNGRLIFEWELGHIPTRKICSPLRTGDDDPSFIVKQTSSGIWWGQDFGGDQWNGNAIQFIQRRYGLTFPAAMQKIIEDLGLKEKSRIYKPIVKTIKSVKIEKAPKHFEFTDEPFDSKHAAYWNKYHLSEDFLRKNNVYRVKDWAIDKIKQPKTEGELTFCYHAEDINMEKILRIGPNVPKGSKWRSQMTNDYLWSYWRYIDNPVENLFPAKSYKDELVLRLIGQESISLQNEDATSLLENGNVEKINNIAKNVYVTLGADKQGWMTSYVITKATGWDYFNIGRSYYKQDKLEDPSDFVEMYGLEPLAELIKIKLRK